MTRDEARPRPNIPPVLSFALAFWAGSAFMWEAGFGISVFLSMLIAVGIAPILFVVRKLTKNRPLMFYLALAFSLGCLLSLVSSHAILQQRDSLQANPIEGELEFFVLEDERQTEFGSSCVALALSHGTPPMKVRVYLDEGQSFRFGERFAGCSTIEPPGESSLDSFNRKGTVARCSVSRPSRSYSEDIISWIAQRRNESISRLAETASEASFNEDAGVFIRAVLFADRADLYESDLYQDVKVCGLAHLVAVSGAHLVIICGFVSTLVDALRVGKRASLGIQLLFLGAYLVMVGFPPSCMRAAVMAVCAHLSSFTLRRPSALNALGMALILFIVADASLAVSLSLQLSALATLGILMLMPLFANWIESLSFKLPGMVGEPLAMTFAATLTTLPLSCTTFSQVPLIGPVANVVATPVLTVVCILGVVGFFLQPVVQLSGVAMTLALLASDVFCSVCSAMATIPYACVPISTQGLHLEVASALVVALLWWFWPRLSGRILCATAVLPMISVALLCFLFPNTGTSLRMIDVGQGDAILLQSEGHNVLVDTGNQPARLLAGLSRAGATHLDAIVITHADDDHCGCLSDMRNIIAVDEVILARGIDEVDSERCKYLVSSACELSGDPAPTYVSNGTEIRFGAWRCCVLWPGELQDDAGNADSICLLATCDVDHDGLNDGSAYLCGDAESEVLKELLAAGSLGDVDIYKVGHHGSRGAITDEQAAILNPEIALVSVGAGNRYGHPTTEVLETLSGSGADIYRTDISGDVVCSFAPSEIRVSTMR